MYPHPSKHVQVPSISKRPAIPLCFLLYFSFHLMVALTFILHRTRHKEKHQVFFGIARDKCASPLFPPSSSRTRAVVWSSLVPLTLSFKKAIQPDHLFILIVSLFTILSHIIFWDDWLSQYLLYRKCAQDSRFRPTLFSTYFFSLYVKAVLLLCSSSPWSQGSGSVIKAAGALSQLFILRQWKGLDQWNGFWCPLAVTSTWLFN